MWLDKSTQHPWVVCHCDDEAKSFTVLAVGTADKDSYVYLHVCSCSRSWGRRHGVWLGQGGWGFHSHKLQDPQLLVIQVLAGGSLAKRD